MLTHKNHISVATYMTDDFEQIELNMDDIIAILQELDSEILQNVISVMLSSNYDNNPIFMTQKYQNLLEKFNTLALEKNLNDLETVLDSL